MNYSTSVNFKPSHFTFSQIFGKKAEKLWWSVTLKPQKEKLFMDLGEAKDSVPDS